MSKKQKYDLTHKIAKLIVFSINTALLLISEKTNLTVVLLIVNFTYFFGVNTVAYMLESILNLKHKHDKV